MCFLLLNGAPKKSIRAIQGSMASLHAEFNFKPYWNGYYHGDGALTIVGHCLRTLNNLLHVTTYALMAIPMLLISPFELPLLPFVLGGHLVAAAVSAITAVLQPIMFTIRTLYSLCCGYVETSLEAWSDWDWCTTETIEQNYWSVAMDPFIPSVNPFDALQGLAY